MLRRGRLPHALLFLGPAGVGKTSMALALAQAAVCERPVEGQACGACTGCGKAVRGTHPDIRLVAPEGRSRTIPIDSVRELRDQAAFRPFEGPNKVFIVREAERMLDPAANALLKTLEEPPPASLILLTATEEADLLSTVVSRCLRLRLAPLPSERVVAWLESERGETGPGARLLANLAGGCLGRLDELDSPTALAERQNMLDHLAGLKAGDLLAAMSWAEELNQDEEQRAVRFRLLRLWYRDLLIASVAGPARLLVNADLEAEVRRMGGAHASGVFLAALEALDRAEEAIERMGRSQLALENLTLDLTGLEHGPAQGGTYE